MKTKPNDPIGLGFDPKGGITCVGLTKREYFAALAMQGILSNLSGEQDVPTGRLDEVIAKESIKSADALILELNKEPSDEPRA